MVTVTNTATVRHFQIVSNKFNLAAETFFITSSSIHVVAKTFFIASFPNHCPPSSEKNFFSSSHFLTIRSLKTFLIACFPQPRGRSLLGSTSHFAPLFHPITPTLPTHPPLPDPCKSF
jgi:hypothetical protein